MAEPAPRPVYPVIFVDAIHVKVRDGQVTNRPFYVVIGVTVDGRPRHPRDLGRRRREGAKFWLRRADRDQEPGHADVCIAVCDGLKGLPRGDHHRLGSHGGADLHPAPDPQHLPLRPRKYWDQMAKDLRPIYTAPTEAAAEARFEEFAANWGAQYPAIIALWRNAWSEFVPFLDYDVEIRGSSAARTRSSRSTPATGARCGPAGTSRPSRPR